MRNIGGWFGRLGGRRVAQVPLVAVLAAVLLGMTEASGDPVEPVAMAPFERAPEPFGVAPSKTDTPRKGEEVPELRTRSSSTFAGPGGTRVAEISPTAVNYRGADGEWAKIDGDLVRSQVQGYAYENAANRFSVRLPENLSGEPVRVQDGDAWATFKLEGAAAVAKVDGNTAAYADVLDGVSARYSVLPDGFKEELTLADKGAPVEYRFAIDAADGLAPKETARGGIEFRDQKGEAKLAIAPSWVADAAGAHGEVQTSIEPKGGGWELTLRLDEQWLQSAKREFPVTVDPTWEFPGQPSSQAAPVQDCFMDQTQPTASFCGHPDIEVGKGHGGAHRGLVKFDVDNAIPDRVEVLDGKLELYANRTQGTPGATVDVHRATQAWDAQASWQNRIAATAWGAAGGDFDATRAAYAPSAGASGAGWVYWQPTELVQSWVNREQSNHGFVLKTDEAGDRIVDFNSIESSDPAKRPKLSVTYQQRVGERRQWTFESQRLWERAEAKVNVANGNLLVHQKDLQIAGTGLPLSVDRTYNNLSDRFAQTGRGWNLNFGGRGTGLQLIWDDVRGDSRALFGPSGYATIFQKKPDGSYTAPTGLDATLVKNPDDTFKLTQHKTDERWLFDAKGWLTARKDRNGNTIAYSNDAGSGAPTKATDTQGRDVTFSQDTDTDLTGISDPSYPGGARNLGYSVQGGKLVTHTDAAGKTTSYQYDGNWNLTKVIAPAGTQTKFGYDTQRRVTSITRVTDNTAGTGPTTTFAYNAASTVVTDPRNKSTTYEYDGKSRVTKVTDAKGNIRTSGYNANSNVNSYNNAGAATALGYDGNDNLTTIDQPAGEKTTNEYADLAPANKYKRSKSTAPSGSSQAFTYDSFGNLGTTTQGSSPTQIQAKLEHNGGPAGMCPNDPATKPGTVRCAIDGKNNQTRYGYDVKGNLIKITPPVTTVPGSTPLGATTITNDSVSRVKTVTDGKGQTKTFSYDKLDRVTNIAYSNGTSVAYSYDDNGNQTQRNDSVHGITGHAYDKLNRRSSDTYPSSVTNSYGYDAASNLTSLTDSGGSVSYAYDDVNLMSSLTEPGSLTTSFAYNARDEETSRAFPNGVTQTTTPDPSGKPGAIEAKKGATTLSKFTYDYIVGTKDTALRQSVTDKDNNKTTYDYYTTHPTIANDWLKSAVTKNAGGTTTDDRLWEYDNAGNRTKQTANGNATSYAYNQTNQLCWTYGGSSTAGCASPPTGAVPYRYDANGNETQGTAGRTSAYNIRDQLTSLTVGGVTSNFGYAGPSQAERTSNGGTAQRNNVLGLSGQGTSNWTRDENGGLISQRASSAKHYYLTDALGSVTALTDSTGNVAQTYKTDPYGVATGGTGTVNNPWQFAGEYKDPAASANLYKIGARNYDPTLGRWTQQDPLDQADDLTQANRYVYVGGNPVNRIDPSGESWISDRFDDTKKLGKRIVNSKPVRKIGGCGAGAATSMTAVGPLAPWPIKLGAAATGCVGGARRTP